MLKMRALMCAVAVFLLSAPALAEEPAAEEEAEMTLPTCEQITTEMHPKAVPRVTKNKFGACKAECQVAKLKGEDTTGCRSTCRAEFKEDKKTVAACLAG